MMSRRFDLLAESLRRFVLVAPLFIFAVAGLGSYVSAGTVQKTFASPEEAANALVDALSTSDERQAEAILGPAGEKLLHSGDTAADDRAAERFLGAYATMHKLVQEGDEKAVLHVGQEDWPLPIPIVRRGDTWLFDTAAGADEIINRRIGRNELNAIQVCLAIVDAQREYAAVDRDGSGVRAFARELMSTPNKTDGLYWPTGPGEDPSPLGRLLARAVEEGYPASTAGTRPVPYHGYYYRILTGQGKDAPGGDYDYLVKGKLVGGFALVAYPARYRVSGIMTLMINNDGVVYEKDLGSRTHAIARTMTKFNPDKTWRRVQAPATMAR